MDIKIERTKSPKEKPVDYSSLGFGTVFTDHMFMMNYDEGKGWHSARIMPYGPITLDPAATCLHYGQLIFEGMKAYKTKGGKIVMFRPDENMKRLNSSGSRLCIPPVDEQEMIEAISRLVEVDSGWIPDGAGTSLYIRPFIYSTEAVLGVHPSKSYMLVVILSPVGAYYPEGMKPVRIYVEDRYVRTVRGGTGFTKCAGNYAASFKSQEEANRDGYAQVLWIDGVERKYIEEVGAMNVFFVIGDTVVTPELNGSILPGITRKSVLQILKRWGIPVEERPVSIEELDDAYRKGQIKEAFGTGTAAVISPIGELKWRDSTMAINNGEIGSLSQRLYNELTGIQLCERPDPDQWIYAVNGDQKSERVR